MPNSNLFVHISLQYLMLFMDFQQISYFTPRLRLLKFGIDKKGQPCYTDFKNKGEAI